MAAFVGIEDPVSWVMGSPFDRVVSWARYLEAGGWPEGEICPQQRAELHWDVDGASWVSREHRVVEEEKSWPAWEFEED